MSSYFEKLKDPRWQKRRLDVFQSANFACAYCSDATSPLHAHHLEYIKGKDPWDYDDSQLICLCDACHLHWHDRRDELNGVLAGLTAIGLDRVTGYALAISSLVAVPADSDVPLPSGFKGKGWHGLLGPSGGEWVKGLADAVNGLRNNSDDAAAWKVAEHIGDGRAQVRKSDILSYCMRQSDPDAVE
jgi:hypothetical protein